MQTEYEVFCLVYFVLFAYNMQVVGKIIIIYIAAHTHVCLLYQIITEAARADAAAIYGCGCNHKMPTGRQPLLFTAQSVSHAQIDDDAMPAAGR